MFSLLLRLSAGIRVFLPCHHALFPSCLLDVQTWLLSGGFPVCSPIALRPDRGGLSGGQSQELGTLAAPYRRRCCVITSAPSLQREKFRVPATSQSCSVSHLGDLGHPSIQRLMGKAKRLPSWMAPVLSSHGGPCLRHQIRETALHCSIYRGQILRAQPGPQACQGQHQLSPSPKYLRRRRPGPGHRLDVSKIALAVDITPPPMGEPLFSHRLCWSLEASLILIYFVFPTLSPQA